MEFGLRDGSGCSCCELKVDRVVGGIGILILFA